ncbi:MAG: hypothetical protein RIC80_16800 [Cyclobacteriaceae bacterium]
MHDHISSKQHTLGLLLFRFFVAYTVLYTLFFPFEIIPYIDELTYIADDALQHLIISLSKSLGWVAEDYADQFSGSGDRTINYLQLAWYCIFSSIAALIWTGIDKTNKFYNVIKYCHNTLLRYYLGYKLMIYGFFKIFKSQFPNTTLDSLVTPYGEMSPMGVLWRFMGYSESYNMFAGLAEAIPGLLLFHRRTALLGALLGIGAMSNVVMLNFTYDVPVKLFSTHLLIFLSYLALPHLKDLAQLFVLGRGVTLNFDQRPKPLLKLDNTPFVILKVLFIIFMIYSTASVGYKSQRSYGDLRPKIPFQGLYNAQLFVRNGDTIPPLIGDSTRWRYLAIERQGRSTIIMCDGKKHWLDFSLDTLTNNIYLKSERLGIDSTALSYVSLGDSTLFIRGPIMTDQVFIELQTVDVDEFNLNKRGFNWINEVPYNR